ncbi:MAG: helix-turn-helix domain-containing protein [Myxococcota bacterium]
MRLDVDERRAQLIALGRELFAKHAYEELSVGEIARRAGISKGLLYHYFPSKRDFYVAVIRATAGELLARVTPDEPTDDPMPAISAYLDYVEAHFGAYAMVLRSGIGNDAEVMAIVDETRGAMVDRILDGARVDAPSAVLKLAIRGWVGFAEATCLDWVQDREVDRTRLARLLARTLLETFSAAEAL